MSSAALADEPTQSPGKRSVEEATGAVEVYGTIVITVDRRRSVGFFEQYIFSEWYGVDLTALLAESEGVYRVARGVLEPTAYVTAPLEIEPWREEHIGIAVAF